MRRENENRFSIAKWLFAFSKLGWIRQHQRDVRGQDRETPREYLDRESHYVWGRRYLLQQQEVQAGPRIELSHNRLTHNGRFIALMDQFMPRWQGHWQTLNRLPVRHEHWGY